MTIVKIKNQKAQKSELKKRKIKFDKVEEISKIVLTSNYDKTMQSIDSLEAYAYGTSKI